jgi:uncharacterized protein (DUF2384 family)
MLEATAHLARRVPEKRGRIARPLTTWRSAVFGGSVEAERFLKNVRQFVSSRSPNTVQLDGSPASPDSAILPECSS